MTNEREPDEAVIITGLSGAGRSTAADALEDIGYFVIDNMPPSLILRVIELAYTAEAEPLRMALGCDIREGAFLEGLDEALRSLVERGVKVQVLFCEASDDVLVRRFDESRRPHPLAGQEGVREGIQRERTMLADLKSIADFIIDTSALNVHQLRDRVKTYFAESAHTQPLRVTVYSFGFKYGPPRDADLVFDVRFLPNPHWIDHLRPLSGKSEAVREYVLMRPETAEFQSHLYSLIDFLLPHYVAEGKSYLVIAIGCTGGRHRSVALAQDLSDHVEKLGYGVTLTHRDVDNVRKAD